MKCKFGPSTLEFIYTKPSRPLPRESVSKDRRGSICDYSSDDPDPHANRETKLAVGAALIDGDFNKAVGILIPESRAQWPIAESPGVLRSRKSTSSVNPRSGPFQITKRLPPARGEFEYVIRSAHDGHEWRRERKRAIQLLTIVRRPAWGRRGPAPGTIELCMPFVS
jgi:hypothetical protein